MIRCTLCGEFYDVGRVFVSVQTVACDQCVSKLLDDETARRSAVHNHGSEDGPGLACREAYVFGKLRGECMKDVL